MKAKRRTPTILVVDDVSAVRKVLAALLRRNGYRVVLAADGEEALGRLSCGPAPDLILMDVVMPDLDGWRALEYLRRGPHRLIPVVIITGSELDPVWATEHGADGFLAKPLDEATLLAEIRRCLSKAEGEALPQPASDAVEENRSV